MATFKCTNCKNKDGTDRVFDVSEAYSEGRPSDTNDKGEAVAFCPHCGAVRSKCEET